MSGAAQAAAISKVGSEGSLVALFAADAEIAVAGVFVASLRSSRMAGSAKNRHPDGIPDCRRPMAPIENYVSG